MTTATRKPTVLAELEKYEERWQAAADGASQASRTFAEKHAKALALLDQARAAAHRDPELIDHQGNPVDPKNEVGKLHGEIAKLGDLADLQARAEHARKIEEKAKREAHAFIAENYDAIVEALEPEAETIKRAVQERAQALAEVADSYLGMVQRVQGFQAADRTLSSIRVPGLEDASNLVRIAQGFRDTELPNPATVRRP